MTQSPSTGDFLLRWRGDLLTVTLTLDGPRPGHAFFRTNLGHASIRRKEIIAETDEGITPMARAWTDLPMPEISPGRFSIDLKLKEVGVFSGKACFFPEGSSVPEWPDGANTHIKVESEETRGSNSIYCVFPRQFGSFREIVRRLPMIMDTMGFRIIQTLPPFPVPTSYGVMGPMGCPFAATDFLSVDPAMAEFDTYRTPLDQFRELIGAVHARQGRLFIDLPANHTGWASTLQTHHPDWFHRAPDGRFVSPGAWGVTWADLVELDYSNAALRSYMADVFLFWCRRGVDGFRCDAGYMIPVKTWEYIVARVREEYPDTVFMLEGLGGDVKVTDRLLAESNLDWAYSELFQTYDRNAFEWYLPEAFKRSSKFGTLVHFAETHDNDRLAKGGDTYARLRVQLAALLSSQGAWGIANGVEWYATEKIDVHSKNDLRWGNDHNMVDLIARLNDILRSETGFTGHAELSVVTRGSGNTLAVLRKSPEDGSSILTLANLDCANSAVIDWDHSSFSHQSCRDLLSGVDLDCRGAIELAPGEVRCLRPPTKTAVSPSADVHDDSPQPLFHLRLPQDIRRDVVVPQGQISEVTSNVEFRIRLNEPRTGKTVFVTRSHGGRAVFAAPGYEGDGTRCRELYLDFTRYEHGISINTRSRFLIPPTEELAHVQLEIPGREIRLRLGERTVLSNGAGAASQMRLGWGDIRSQYDAILSANPDREVPSDRFNLWTRTRCWLQREGYLREIDSRCTSAFFADPAGRFAKWHFKVPCGMGREVAFIFTVSLIRDENVASLSVVRVPSGSNDIDQCVRLVFRPDLEWRSYHATTKAYRDGLEGRFASSAIPLADGRGVSFSPYGKDSLVLEVGNAEYHHETLWTYSVSHEEEAARGQDGCGDLFSPGWISADLAQSEAMWIRGSFVRSGEERTSTSPLSYDAVSRLNIPDALRQAMNLFIVRRNDLKTVIAGYPWFLDWGRDTFIFMRGMIASGMIADSLKILQAFAAFEEKGTLPNIIYGNTAGNRDTTDAQLWFIRCVQEIEAAGNVSKDALDSLKMTCASIVDHYLSGTPNGIRVDKESALVWSPSHFTWMDTNYPACTPRVGYPVEIQALWISALRFLGREDLAELARTSVIRLFGPANGGIGYADCLDAPNGETAANARPDRAIRPNQLLLLTLGILDDSSILDATERLLIPCGIRSIDSEDIRYRGVYSGDEDSCRKPAYHNGTAWAWMFPAFAEAMALLGRSTPEVARQLLSGAIEQLNHGCIGHISEIADGDSPHLQKGCAAQAWSISELLRVWLAVEKS